MKMYKPERTDQIRILDSGELPSFEQFFQRFDLNEEDTVMPCPSAIVQMNVIDLKSNENKILSLPAGVHKALNIAIKEMIALNRTRRLLSSQAAAARRFKASKLMYRRNRNV